MARTRVSARRITAVKKRPGTAAAWNQKVRNQGGRGKGSRKSLPGQSLTVEGPGGITSTTQPVRRRRFKQGSK
jgi:hypothetical protein